MCSGDIEAMPSEHPRASFSTKTQLWSLVSEPGLPHSSESSASLMDQRKEMRLADHSLEEADHEGQTKAQPGLHPAALPSRLW